MVVAGLAVASSAGADPSTTPTPTPSSTAPSPSTAPGPTATDSAAPTSSATPTNTPATSPTSAPPTSAVPAGSHQVTYTVTTTSDLTANIYYVTADPPSQSAANDPKYMPIVRQTVGPGAPWTLQTTLNDATKWAFVSASGGLRVNPEFHCEIAVDGQVVVSQQGGSGVQCALRPW
jgi:hypothetical protein